MSTRDPKEKDAPRTLVTAGGVQVIVKPAEPAREPAAKGPRVIIVPDGLTEAELRSFMDGLCRANAKLVEEALDRRKDVLPESRKDLRQEVLLILCEHVARERRVPENLEAWLDSVVQKLVRNHKDLWKVPRDPGADPEAVLALFDAEPDKTADFEERRRMLERYLPFLPEEQAVAFRCHKLYCLTLEETAQTMDVPLSSVHDLMKEAAKKLRRLAIALSEGRASAAAEGDKKT